MSDDSLYFFELNRLVKNVEEHINGINYIFNEVDPSNFSIKELSIIYRDLEEVYHILQGIYVKKLIKE